MTITKSENEGACLIPLCARDGSIVATAIIDAADAHLAQHRWYRTHIDTDGRGGYVARTTRNPRQVIYLHRAVLGVTADIEVDHFNGDRLNCRRANLRLATRQQNAENQPARGGRSPHRGVCFDRRNSRWYALVQQRGTRKWLGYFDTDDEAAAAAAAWREANLEYTNEQRAVAR